MGNHTNDMVPEGYNFVDCSYLNILFTFGIILALAAIAAHAFLAYKNRKDLRFVLVIEDETLRTLKVVREKSGY